VDLLAGTDELRQALDSGGDRRPIDDLLSKWEADAAGFMKDRERFLLYCS